MLYTTLITSNLNKNKPIISDCKNDYTYKEIDDHCGKIQVFFEEKGFEKGDKVIIISNQSINTILVILTCMRMGMCFIPVPNTISQESLLEIITDSKAEVLVGDIESKCIRTLYYSEIFEHLHENVPQKSYSIGEENISYILYTSGSTGKSKGVVALEKQVLFCIKSINKRLKNTEKDKILCFLPLYFDYGLYQIFLALDSGACVYVPQQMPIQSVVHLLYKKEITGFPAMPAILNMLIKTKLLDKVVLDKLRYITSTGDVLSIELIKKVLEILPAVDIIPMYGLTECKRVSVMPPKRFDKVINGSCGLPLDGVKVWLSDVDSNGIGELVVCGPNVMEGYWNDIETSSKYYFINEDNIRCLYTGDLFRIDSEGFLYFIERKKNILKVNGYRIGISELEDKIKTRLDSIEKELAVIGIPDKLSGEKIVVCISSDYDRKMVLEKIKDSCEYLSQYQKPHLLFYSNDFLIRNSNGKIDRKRIKELIVKNENIELFKI